MLVATLGILIGIGLPLQTAINSKLKTATKSPFIASFISFTIGCVALSLLVITIKPNLNSVQISHQPLWLWIGGVLGAIFLTGNILLLPKIGSFQTVLMPIIGQVAMSMIIDSLGLFDSKVIPFNILKLIGATVVLLGATVTIYTPQNRAVRVPKANKKWSLRICGILTGIFSAMQTAINGHLGIVYGSSLFAATISFLVGWLCLLALILIKDHSVISALKLHVFRQLPLWSWLGGIIGASFVLGNVVMMPILGTGLSITIVLTGQLLGSILIGNFGWFDVPKSAITRNEIIGLLLIISGILIMKLF
ncbi:hypothetical protein FC83_GL001451 [Agrilactobacillus composti DSM 18527 = JCM 14202]|uniref:Integral membrane protein n=1 Tax=Agrilactobacillus composti DSM 18527 = JCM 14202 TaxID=1423734 RepID=X0PFT1_9LACO|nr:DMT family transporter [Agrilactobacillus composti]KRM30890.1 hypothetical protein FC83_GL001451 [Agrilactobacillus composti DSM 18527 = JCM 14202]GAF40824.1 hypothetical protein JCM14202_2732 [Agrilactobacillus composti DSM 18527 = JCM 14202]